MKLQVTNEKLLKVNSEIEQIASTAVGMLLAGKVSEFYKNNGERIKAVQEKILAIQKKHLVFEDGKIKFPERKEGDVSPMIPVFLIGHCEADLQNEYKELVSLECTIEV